MRFKFTSRATLCEGRPGKLRPQLFFAAFARLLLGASPQSGWAEAMGSYVCRLYRICCRHAQLARAAAPSQANLPPSTMLRAQTMRVLSYSSLLGFFSCTPLILLRILRAWHRMLLPFGGFLDYCFTATLGILELSHQSLLAESEKLRLEQYYMKMTVDSRLLLCSVGPQLFFVALAQLLLVPGVLAPANGQHCMSCAPLPGTKYTYVTILQDQTACTRGHHTSPSSAALLRSRSASSRARRAFSSEGRLKMCNRSVIER